MMRALHVFVVGLSAFLLFQIQPLISKVILPRYGGGASTWITSLVFFQLVLLLGYGAAHGLLARLGGRRALILQALLVILCLPFLPVRAWDPGPGLSGVPPSFQILLTLAASVGLPFLVLSTTSPAVQHWIGLDPGAKARNPYVLYAFSNGGSLLGLLAYPILVEPSLPSRSQLRLWSIGFLLHALVLLGCIAARWRRSGEAGREGPGTGPVGASRGDRLRWLLLGSIPSAALVAITHHLNVDIASFPFLWVLPLALYLVSFVICFLFPGVSSPRMIRSILVLLPLGALVPIGRGVIHVSLLQGTIIACAAVFTISTYYHGELERSKPPPRGLTAFYLHLALGASIGGVLVGLAAPLLLRGNFEFILVILTAMYGVLLPYVRRRRPSTVKACHAALVLVIAGSYLNEEWTVRSDLRWRGRSFYGTYKIREFPEIPGEQVEARLLYQGTTVHGGQARYPDGRFIPLTYYFEATGVGQAFAKLPGLERIGLVGLGTGLLSVYGREGQSFDFFEIDELNIHIARTQFDLLKSCPAKVRTIPGDARVSLREVPDGTYDLLVLDAFSSGAIPTHLLTLEAVEEYLRVLRPQGALLFHVSNRHVRLAPILGGIGRRLGLAYGHHFAPEDDLHLKFKSDWVALTRSPATLARLTTGTEGWTGPPSETTVWTDEASDLWSVIKWSP